MNVGSQEWDENVLLDCLFLTKGCVFVAISLCHSWLEGFMLSGHGLISVLLSDRHGFNHNPPSHPCSISGKTTKQATNVRKIWKTYCYYNRMIEALPIFRCVCYVS